MANFQYSRICQDIEDILTYFRYVEISPNWTIWTYLKLIEISFIFADISDILEYLELFSNIQVYNLSDDWQGFSLHGRCAGGAEHHRRPGWNNGIDGRADEGPEGVGGSSAAAGFLGAEGGGGLCFVSGPGRQGP